MHQLMLDESQFLHEIAATTIRDMNCECHYHRDKLASTSDNLCESVFLPSGVSPFSWASDTPISFYARKHTLFYMADPRGRGSTFARSADIRSRSFVSFLSRFSASFALIAIADSASSVFLVFPSARDRSTAARGSRARTAHRAIFGLFTIGTTGGVDDRR